MEMSGEPGAPAACTHCRVCCVTIGKSLGTIDVKNMSQLLRQSNPKYLVIQPADYNYTDTSRIFRLIYCIDLIEM
jgi:hypothetical protein